MGVVIYAKIPDMYIYLVLSSVYHIIADYEINHVEYFFDTIDTDIDLFFVL